MTRKRLRSILILLVTLVVAGLTFSSPPAYATHDKANCDVQYVTGKGIEAIKLQIFIPGVTKTYSFTADGKLTNDPKEIARQEHYVKDLPCFIADLYRFLVGIAGIVALLAVMYGGYKWLFARGNAAQVEDARETILSATLGLLLVFSSFVILNLINPRLVNLPEFKPKLPTIVSYGQAARVCTGDEDIKARRTNPNFGCGNFYFPNLEAYLREDCLTDHPDPTCEQLKKTKYDNGCMGVTCLNEDRVCSITADKDGYLLSGGCVQSVTALVNNKGILAKKNFPVNQANCGAAFNPFLIGDQNVGRGCSSGNENTCTLLNQEDKEPWLDATQNFLGITTWGIFGYYKEPIESTGDYFLMSCRPKIPSAVRPQPL